MGLWHSIDRGAQPSAAAGIVQQHASDDCSLKHRWEKIAPAFLEHFGTGDVEMKSVHMALNPSVTTSSVIDPATDTALKFGGAESAVIPVGKDIWSDAFEFNLPAMTNVAITIYYGKTSAAVTGHPSSRCASYLATGNTVAATNMDDAIKTEHWYNIEDIDVAADDSYGTVVTFGDSITDGRGSTTGANNRWPDILAQRLLSQSIFSAFRIDPSVCAEPISHKS